MNEEDKAISTIAASASEDFIKRVDARDKLVRIIEVVMLLIIVVINTFAIASLNRLAVQSNDQVTKHTKEINAATDRNAKEHDVISCILTITPLTRTNESIANCYKQSGVKPGPQR